MWTTVIGAQLLFGGITDAAAKEYRLNPAASGVTISDTLRMDPVEIDSTRPDYVLIVRFRNDGNVPLVMHTPSMRCLRGDAEFIVRHAMFGIGERWLDLMPGESKSVQLLCEHGRIASGDFGLIIPAVHTNPVGDGRTLGEPLVTDFVWRLQEGDILRERQLGGEQLAHVTYRRPAPEPEPIVVAPPPRAPRPLAIPGNAPPPPPHATPAPAPSAPPPPPPPPPAALRPR